MGNPVGRGAQPEQLEWPDDTEPLEPISLSQFRQALVTFLAGTGLGWDGIHPRALLRLPDDVLQQWMVFVPEVRKGREVAGWDRNCGGGTATQT